MDNDNVVNIFKMLEERIFFFAPSMFIFLFKNVIVYKSKNLTLEPFGRKNLDGNNV
jgi:hypothetical protein